MQSLIESRKGSMTQKEIEEVSHVSLDQNPTARTVRERLYWHGRNGCMKNRLGSKRTLISAALDKFIRALESQDEKTFPMQPILRKISDNMEGTSLWIRIWNITKLRNNRCISLSEKPYAAK
jgi:hypothetical protein